MRRDPEQNVAGRGKAEFAALRETVGISMSELARELGSNKRTVLRWESPEETVTPPRAAWELLDAYMETQRQMVDHCRETCMSVAEEEGDMPEAVAITYYRSQEQFDRFGRDSGPYTVANANARAVATELRHYGYKVEFRYPEEGAVRTPGSNY